jgi:hypothetical protein
MTYEHISALLEKYWEGESTLEEERTLKTYFASGQVEEPFRQWMPMFQALQTEQGIQYTKKAPVAEIRPQQYQWQAWAVAASLALTLIAGSWWYFNRTSDIQEVVQTPVSQPKTETAKQIAPAQIPVVQPSTNGSVAPVPAVESVAKIEKPKHKLFRKKPAPVDSFDDPEQAYAEIKAALALVSSKINRGKTEAAKNINRIDTIDKFFKKKKESQG